MENKILVISFEKSERKKISSVVKLDSKTSFLSSEHYEEWLKELESIDDIISASWTPLLQNELPYDYEPGIFEITFKKRPFPFFKKKEVYIVGKAEFIDDQ
jgi:hypothetical protein